MLAYLFVAIAVGLRFLPHPLSVTPLWAALLFFGARAPRRRMWVPLLMVAAADVLLTTLKYGYAIPADHFVTWAWAAGIIFLGGILRENARPLRLIGAALATSISFFLVSNFAVWMVWDMYPKTLQGLLACYVAAIPFFRNQPVADLVFTLTMFATPSAIAALKRATALRIPAA